MSTFNSISQLFGLISLIAIIWLAVGAFRNGRLSWGLGILFGPLIPVVIYLVYFWSFGPSRYHLYIILAVALITPATAIYYALNFWVDVKKPFLVYMTSFVLSAASGIYVFSASGGWAMLGASQNVARGIAQGNLTEADALKFMNSNLDMIESSGLGKEEQKKMDFMREFLKKAEGGFTEQEQSEVQKGFQGMMPPPDKSETNPATGEKSEGNKKQPESKEASLKRTPVVQSDGDTMPEETHGLQNRNSAPQVTMIRFSQSGPDGKSDGSDALAQAKGWIGRFVLVTPNKGVPQQGILIEVSGNGLRLEKNMSAGFVTLPFEYDEIESIQVLK